MQRQLLTVSQNQTNNQAVFKQCLSWKTKLPILFYLWLLLLSMALYDMDYYPFSQFGSAVLGVSPLSLLPTRSLLTVGAEWEKENLDGLHALLSDS